MALFETVDLGQKYGDQYVLEGINLKIDKGEVFALIGPTGAGKTTLLRLLDLLEAPAAGKVYFDGIDVNCSRRRMLEVRRRMAFVQQKPVVFTMSVFDNVACGLRWRCEKGEIVRRKVEDILEIVGMTKYRDRNAKTLSGGETQRVAVARVLVTDPEVLLLDEPTANLDPISTLKIEEVLAKIIGEHKITVVMATHDMSQGQRFADRVGVLVDGKMLQVGSPREVFTLPENREVAEFVGVENILAGVVSGKDDGLAAIDVNGSVIEAISDYEVGERVYALIRPEDITLSRSKETGSARNTFPGKIEKVVLVGPLVRVEVNSGFPLLALVTKKSAEEMNLTIGTLVHASFKASAIRTLKRWD
jgi:tungstate transport system ATP-binding protein